MGDICQYPPVEEDFLIIPVIIVCYGTTRNLEGLFLESFSIQFNKKLFEWKTYSNITY